jgi:8-oxo-dGTP diphosphatase
MCLCLLTGSGADGRRRVLLGHKKTGLGTGKIVGLGGHVEPGESAKQAAVREVEEEAGLVVNPAALREVAEVTFLFPARPRWDQIASVFSASEWTGEPTESEEITPRWFPMDELPLTRMWDDARYWLPQALAGQRLTACFTFADDCETVLRSHLDPAPPRGC